MAKKTGLGKGLDSLISNKYMSEESTDLSTKEAVNVDNSVDKLDKSPEILVNIALVEPNRDQPRKIFEEEGLKELADSIRQFGVIQPLIVRKTGEHYEIIAGERRWRAAKMAGLSEVPVILREYDEKEKAEIALIENIQREDLNPMEEAMAYQSLIREYHLKQDELAKRVSKSRTAVANMMRLLKLDPAVQAMVSTGAISEGHARALLGLNKSTSQEHAAQIVIGRGLSVRETEKLVKQMNTPPAEKKKEEDPDREDYKRLEDSLKQYLGTKVTVDRKEGDKGAIKIEYYSIEELDRITSILRRGSEG